MKKKLWQDKLIAAFSSLGQEARDYLEALAEQIDGCLINTDVGLYPAQQNLVARQFVELAVELIGAAATKSRFVYRLIVGEQLRYLRDCGSQSIGALLTP